MIGAIIGDIAGSIYEGRSNVRFEGFFGPNHFPTDDTILTLATMEVLLGGGDYGEAYHRWGRQNPYKGYGGRFRMWLKSDRPSPYGSYGNGAGMRVSPVGWYFDTWEEVLAEAERSAEVTHNHPEGIKGAQAIAGAVFLARTVKDKEVMRSTLASHFGYDLDRHIDERQIDRKWDETCQGTVPLAILAFLDSADFEDAVYRGIHIGWDSDTIACMAGAIAEAYYDEIPTYMIDEALNRLPVEYVELVERFYTSLDRRLSP